MTGDTRDTLVRGGDVHTARLLTQLEQFQSSSSGKAAGEGSSSKDGGKGGGKDGSKGVYSVYVRPGGDQDDTAALASLAVRLVALESSVAMTPEQMSLLTMETGQKTLTGAVKVIN